MSTLVSLLDFLRVLTIQGNLDAVLNVIGNVLPSLEEVYIHFNNVSSLNVVKFRMY